MPNIKDYSADIPGLRPNEAGLDATVQGARRINAFASQAAEDDRRQGAELGGDIREAGKIAVDYIDHQQIAHGAMQSAQMQVNLTKQWNDTLKNSDPNDPAVADNFRTKVVEPSLEKLGEGFSTEKGQQWAEGHVNELRQQWFKKTAADQSSLAGEAVTQNVHQIANSYSNIASADPASLDFTLKQTDDALKGIVGSSPTLSAEDGARVTQEVGQKIKEGIVKAALVSAINTNPEAGLKMAQDPKYAPYVNGAEANAMYKDAVRNQKIDTDMSKRTQREQLEQNSQDNLNHVIKSLYDPEAKQRPNAADIAKLPDNMMRPSDREHAIKLIDAELKPQAESKASALAANDALKGIREGRVDMDGVYKLKEANTITRSDFDFLQKQVVDYRDAGGNSLPKVREAFIKRFGKMIDSSNDVTGKIDEAGGRHLWAFENELSRREGAMRQAGKDPHSLYDDKSPDFMGSAEAMRPFRKTFQEEQEASFKETTGVSSEPAAPPATKYKVGETITRNGVTRRFKGGDWRDKSNYETIDAK